MKVKKWLFSMLIAVGMFSTHLAVHASDYGCKVLLCLANPNGPMAVSECVPPISQLYRDLARGRAFPTCDMAEGPSGRSYARQDVSYYDPCPEGTTALTQGAYAIQGTSAPQGGYYQGANRVYSGIGSGDELRMSGDDTGLPGKVCVGTKVGDTTTVMGDGDSQSVIGAGVYDRVVMIDAQGSPRVIDVFIDDQLYRRVRW
jgi:hypothetical protein